MGTTFEYPEIVIGDTLAAVSRAYYYEIPIIIKDRPNYFFFDKCGNSEKSKFLLWEEYVFQLSMCGLVPFGLNVNSIHVDEDQKHIEVITKEGHKYDIVTKKIIYGSLTYETRIKEKQQKFLQVIDSFSVKSGRVHNHTSKDLLAYPPEEGGLCHSLIFHRAHNYYGKEDYKDVVTISTIPEKSIDSFEYSETMARLKLESIMKEMGIRGKKKGTTWNGKPAILKIKTEHLKRIVRPVYGDESLAIVMDSIYSLPKINKNIEKIKKTFGDPYYGTR